MTEQLQTLIAGEWRDASGPEYTTEYPHDGSIVASLHAANAADVDAAVQAAERARLQPAWAKLKHHERAGMLYRIAAGIRERAEELAQLQRLDNGKPIKECRALVASAAGTFQFFGAAAETWEETITPSRGDYLSMSVHEPLGVVGAITPWNSPIASEAQKLAPALAAGCAMVFKPAEITPRMAIELAKIAQKAGVPDGIISVLPGKGSVVGDALVKHPLVKRIAFTGGTTVGMGIQRLAAEKLMPTSLELGGKSPTIVCADADLDHAVAGVIYGIFSSSGESCIAGSRAFVHESVYNEFKQRLLAAVARLRVADPSLEDTHMGPLVNMGHRASVEKYVQMGLDEGGKLLAGGKRPTGGYYDKGSYYLPTVFEGLANTAQMCREEIFGPVLALLPWKDEADLIAQSNDNMFGLASGIWSRDFKTAWRIGSALQTGTVWVNTYKVFSIATPFSGVKMSGYGQEKGRLGILEYTSQKSFYWGAQRVAHALERFMIEGIDAITYSTDRWDDARRFFGDWGLKLKSETPARQDWRTLNDCGVNVIRLDDPAYPAPIEAGPTLREVVWGVTDAADLDAIAVALAGVPGFADGRKTDGTLSALDPHGLKIVFRVMQKKKIDVAGVATNPWGDVRRIDTPSPIYERAEPVEVGHVVLFTDKLAEAVKFYEALGFITSDSYPGRGMFMRASADGGHHDLFLLQVPGKATGLNHVAFTVRDIHEVFGGGLHISRCGWKTQLGPGRHPISSAYFWYFENPCGGLIEYNADEDHLTPAWQPREFEPGPTVFAEWAVDGGLDGNTRRQKNAEGPTGKFLTEKK